MLCHYAIAPYPYFFFFILLQECAHSSTSSSHLEPLLFVTILVVFPLTCLLACFAWRLVSLLSSGWVSSEACPVSTEVFVNSLENLCYSDPRRLAFLLSFREITWLHGTINSKLQFEGLIFFYWAPTPAPSLSFYSGLQHQSSGSFQSSSLSHSFTLCYPSCIAESRFWGCNEASGRKEESEKGSLCGEILGTCVAPAVLTQWGFIGRSRSCSFAYCSAGFLGFQGWETGQKEDFHRWGSDTCEITDPAGFLLVQTTFSQLLCRPH